MSFEDEDSQDWVTEIFAEAQESVSMFKRVASMLGQAGSMRVTGRAFRERLRRAGIRPPKPRMNAAPVGFTLQAHPCLLCGKLPQEYGSCRCADCNQQRRLKRRHPHRPARTQDSP
jgi:hypothetical protein